MPINPNYVSYALMLICGLLAVNIYRLRRHNGEITEQLTSVNDQLTVSASKKGECETSLQSQKNALQELQTSLETKKKENAELVINLTNCQKHLEENKQKLEEMKKQQEEAAKLAAKQAADAAAKKVAEAADVKSKEVQGSAANETANAMQLEQY